MFAARKLGLKESPPAYLSLAPRTIPLVVKAVAEGVNYASAGAGILDSTVSRGSTSTTDQLHLKYHYQP
jgi:hypothetical protein